MKAAIEQFRQNIAYVRHLSHVHAVASSSPGLDASDILRAQIVSAVSALDHYVHEVTRLGTLEVFNRKRTRTPAFDRARVSLEAVLTALDTPGGDDWLDDQIRHDHSFQSFQTPDKIADAVRLFSSVPLWERVAEELHVDLREVKDQLKLIVDRRNKIAHEADLDPTYPGVRWPIDAALVNGAVDFIEQVCEAIHRVAL